MTSSAHIACLQTRPIAEARGALEHALGLAAEAISRGARFLVLPEYCGGLRSEEGMFRPPVVEEADHPFLTGMAAFAAEHRVWVLIGSLAVPGTGALYRNRSILLDNEGRIVSRYDKVHLFDIDLGEGQAYRESATVEPGDRAVVADTPWGRLGHSICYDLRFASLYRSLSLAGAQMLAVPAAFTRTTGEAHWHMLNRARAVENGCFVIAPCSVGAVEGGGEAYGHSLIVGPWGEVLAEGGDEPCVVDARIDLEEAAAARCKIPALRHGRAFRPAALSEPRAAAPELAA